MARRLRLSLSVRSLGIIPVVSTSATLAIGGHLIDPDMKLQFSDQYYVNEAEIEKRDRAKPFFFHLLNRIDGLKGDPPAFTVDKGTTFKVWLDEQVSETLSKLENARSLAIQITADHDENAKDKIFLDAVPHWSNQKLIVNAGPRYFAFDFMLDPEYELPTAWAIHLQAWQCCGGHPPFAMSITPSKDKNGPAELFFGFRDDLLEHKNGSPAKTIFNMKVNRGDWNNFILQLDPETDNSAQPGVLALWLNGKPQFCFRAHWGFDPERVGDDGHKITNAMGIDIGVYRRRQSTTQTVYFNNIRSGTTFQAVSNYPVSTPLQCPNVE
jgi:hypothetical protein